MRMIGKVLVLAIALSSVALLSAAQTAQRPSFEVVSVKRNTSGRIGGGPVNSIRTPANRFIGTGVPLEALLEYAYRTSDGRPLSADDIINLPEWATWRAGSALFDVMAKVESDAQPISQYQMLLMMQSLLADRFQLKTHWIQLQRDVYRLIVAKGGPKLKLSEDQTDPQVDSSLKTRGQYDAGPARALLCCETRSYRSVPRRSLPEAPYL